MDPHSTHSQFNQRAPKSGPFSPTTRFMEKIAVEKYAKPGAGDRGLSSLAHRPIATNSRVRQGEQFKRDMFIAFVNKALQEKQDGQSKDFDDLVDQFNPRKVGENATSSSQLRLWILALSHVLSRLEKRHAALVEAVVNLPWTTMDTAFVKSYSVFVGMLLSARPEYLSIVLTKIAQGLTYQSGLQALDAGGPEGSASPLTRSVVYDRLHHLLRHLLSIIPTLPSTLHPLLVRNFPHKRQSQVTQVTYIRNLLRITEYCSELADRILALIIDRALQIDVEIQVELEELEQDDTLENADVFDFDPFDVVVGQEGDDDDESDLEDDDIGSDISSDVSCDDQEPDLPPNAQHMQDMVNKLDHILKLVFDHFNRLHYVTETSVAPRTPHTTATTPLSLPPDDDNSPRPLSPDAGRAMRAVQFHSLLAIFDRAIIRTFKSRYTQFLIFWYASLDPEFSDLFQGLLVEKAFSIGQDVPSVTRAAAASYIASFVSRAAFVDREGARRMVAVLCTYLGNHLDAFEGVVSAGGDVPGLAYHGVFYAIAQAVFLIFCFRWRDFDEEGAGEGEGERDDLGGGRKRKWMSELDVVQRAITSALNPLKLCAPTVVLQFARVAQATDFVYCHSIIEANRRSEYNHHHHHHHHHNARPGTPQRPVHYLPRGGAEEELASVELHTFFPFDPYKLPRSGSYIRGVYREWSAVAIGGEESDEEDVDDVGDEDGDEDGVDVDGQVGMCLVESGNLSGGLDIPRSDADGLGESLSGMSISPAQPRSVIMAS